MHLMVHDIDVRVCHCNCTHGTRSMCVVYCTTRTGSHVRVGYYVSVVHTCDASVSAVTRVRYSL